MGSDQDPPRAGPRHGPKGTVIIQPAAPPKTTAQGTVLIQPPSPPKKPVPKMTVTGRRQESIYAMLFKPRWKPWSPRRVALTATGFSLLMGLLIALTPKLGSYARARLFGGPAEAPTGDEEIVA